MSWRLLALGSFAAAGGLFLTSALASGGTELRAASVTDLSTLVRQQRQDTDGLVDRAARLDREVSALSRENAGDKGTRLQKRITALKPAAGMTAVSGSGIRVLLDDAPKSALDEAAANGKPQVENLIVHQQDIQAVVNALWTGEASAISVMGQRIISTTGIKCVGNTVILHGVPYSPPYDIRAVGDPAKLQRALDDSEYVEGYRATADKYGLGYQTEVQSALDVPAFSGIVKLSYATALVDRTGASAQ